MTLAGCNDPLQVITTALAGEVVETLHVVAHGRAGGFQLGGQWVDECALQGAAPLLAQWNVRNIALWSCDVGQDRAFLDALARLTGAEVHASTRALGKVHGQARWALDVPGETPVALPFQAAVAEAWPHQLVSLNFTNAYAVNTATTPAGKESNSLDFVPTSLNVARIDDKTGNQNFSGNDVVVELVVGGNTYYGWISRPIKSGGVIKGFYFWRDAQFTDLNAATTDGNSDGDGVTTDNTGFILVVDQTYFDGLPTTNGLKNVGSSSDRVDSALNSVLPVNGSPVAANDTMTVLEDASAQTGNVLTNDTDPNNDALTVSSFSIAGVSGTFTLGQAKSITGVGSFTLNADGSYSFTPNAQYAGAVPLVTYAISDGKGGTATATLAIQVTPVNDAPAGTDKTLTTRENTAYTFSATDFALTDTTDSPANALAAVKITTLPATGTLKYNGTPVSAGTEIAVADLTKLSFEPAANSSASASFTFQVRDNGGGCQWGRGPGCFAQHHHVQRQQRKQCTGGGGRYGTERGGNRLGPNGPGCDQRHESFWQCPKQ